MTGSTTSTPVREITSHKVNPANDKIQILVTDKPGAGGANHRYEITGFNTATNASKEGPDGYSHSFSKQVILFQNGPIHEKGVNGITQEVLVSIIIDRLESFQTGPYACEENQVALDHFKAGLEALLSRTRKRMERGVEGTHKV